MELLFEFDPVRSRSELLSRLHVLSGLVDWIDVPDSPVGRPRQSSPVVSCLLKSLNGVGVIAHLRTIDYSRVALWSTVRSLALCGVERVVFVRGDVAPGSTVVRDVEPEDAVMAVKRLGVSISPGLTLSLRKEPKEISRRVSVGADFYLVLNLNNETITKLSEVSRIAKASNAKVYPYLVVATRSNYDTLVRILGEGKLVTVEKALEVVASCRDMVDGFLVSSPLDFSGAVDLLLRLRRL